MRFGMCSVVPPSVVHAPARQIPGAFKLSRPPQTVYMAGHRQTARWALAFEMPLRALARGRPCGSESARRAGWHAGVWGRPQRPGQQRCSCWRTPSSRGACPRRSSTGGPLRRRSRRRRPRSAPRAAWPPTTPAAARATTRRSAARCAHPPLEAPLTLAAEDCFMTFLL